MQWPRPKVQQRAYSVRWLILSRGSSLAAIYRQPESAKVLDLTRNYLSKYLSTISTLSIYIFIYKSVVYNAVLIPIYITFYYLVFLFFLVGY